MGNLNYKWPFSIPNCEFTRGYLQHQIWGCTWRQLWNPAGFNVRDIGTGLATVDGFYALTGCVTPTTIGDRGCEGVSVTYAHVTVEAGWKWAMFKIPLSFHNGWVTGIPLLDFYNLQLGRIEMDWIPENVIKQQGFWTLLKWKYP